LSFFFSCSSSLLVDTTTPCRPASCRTIAARLATLWYSPDCRPHTQPSCPRGMDSMAHDRRRPRRRCSVKPV
jgi:hypothetical protein